jgi:hypothetical protein
MAFIRTHTNTAGSAAVLRPMNSRITELESRPFRVLMYSPVTLSDLSKLAEKGCRSLRGHIIGTDISSNRVSRRFKGNTERQAGQNTHSLREL